MNAWILKWKLHKMERRSTPTREFAWRLHDALAAEGFLPTRAKVALGRTWRMAGATLCSLLAVVSSTGVYAYSSDTVLPEHPLYPVRMLVERVELRLARTDDDRERTNLKHAERRTHELALVHDKHGKVPDVYPEQVLQSLEPVLLVKADEAVSALENTEYYREMVSADSDALTEIMDEREIMQAEDDAPSLDDELRDQAEKVSAHLKGWQEAR